MSCHINGRDLAAIQFTPDTSHGHLIWMRDVPTDVEGCCCSIHLLPCRTGFIAEIWNHQRDEPGLMSNAALPKPLTTMQQVLDLLSLCGVPQPALRGGL